DKRDRQSLFQRTEISSDPASFAAHVSLSSHLQLSNNRPDTPVKALRKPKPISPGINQHLSQSARNFRAKVVVASSAAALVSDRAYRPCPFSKSTPPTKVF
ncbi:hypothetical protein, partial [Rhizobium mesoamericanum]|uniref:hypothetical protein n=1 Tax=Rhizobium mesoamericanum TaxID=1079800 RepID=UPI001AEC2782